MLFDTQPTPCAPVTAVSVAAGVVTWRWTPRPAVEDETPNDPLDLPQTTSTWTPVWNGAHTTGTEVAGPTGTGTEFSAPDPGGAYTVGIRATPQRVGRVGCRHRGHHHPAHRVGAFGHDLGHHHRRHWHRPERPLGVLRHVCRTAQRRHAGDPAGAARGPPGRGIAVVPRGNPAARRLRRRPLRRRRPGHTAVPSLGQRPVGAIGRTASRTDGAPDRARRQQGDVSQVRRSTLTAGAGAAAYLWVRPEGKQRATLQFYSAGAWHSLKWVYLNEGRGGYVFTATRRGTTAYRFVVPALTIGGYRVEGVTTPTFTLAVR